MWDCRARLTEPHDGDTFRVLADTLFDGRHEPRLRLLDVHCPELHEAGGPDTTVFVNAWLARAAAEQQGKRWPLYIVTEKTRTAEPEQRRTFVRFLATVWRWDQRPGSATPGASLNEAVRAYQAGHPEWGHGR